MYGYDYYDYYDYGYGYSSGVNLGEVFAIIALITAAVLMVLSFIFIIPARKRDKLPGFFRMVHDIFNFNGLIIEVLMKAAYIFSTIFIIFYSFLMIFTGDDVLAWLITMVVGPVAIRISFELLMMAVLLVKNVITINNKLKYPDDKKPKKEDAFGVDYTKYTEPKNTNPSAMQEPVQNVQTFSGYVQNNVPVQNAKPAQRVCPGCGTVLDGGEVFCAVCGTRITK